MRGSLVRFAASFVLLSAMALEAQTGPGGPAPGGTKAAQTVRVGRVAVTEIPLTTKVGGRLEPANTVSHPANASGVVQSIFVKVGQKVAAGDRLFSVDRNSLTGSFVPAVVAARIAGVVSSISVRVNRSVKDGDAGVVVIDTGAYYLSALLSDKDALAVREGTEVAATAAGGLALRGTIVSRSPEPDYDTGLFTLTVSFPYVPAAHLGQFATVDLPLGTVRGIFLQQNLLQRQYGRYQVWVVDDRNALESRRVTIGAFYGDQVLIKEGLKEGERYLLKRTGSEKAGAVVQAAER